MTGDADALRELLHSSVPGTEHILFHYLYFPSSYLAKVAAKELRQQGYETEERLGVDGISWLVLARHRVIPSETTLIRIRQQMNDIAGRGTGEYDGWEVEVDNS